MGCRSAASRNNVRHKREGTGCAPPGSRKREHLTGHINQLTPGPMRQYLGSRVTLVGLFASVFMIACGGEKTTEPPPQPPEPTSVQLSAATVTVRMGES